MRRTVSLAAVLCLIIAGITVACSGGNTEPAACTYKMTGAQNGTYPCQVLVIASPELTSVVIVPTSLQGAPIKGLGAQWVLHRGVSFLPTTFNSGNVEQADIFVAGGTSVWDMSLHATDQTNHPDQGNFVLNVTSAGSRLSLGTATVWAHAQGTATGTLPAEKNTSASGEISVEIVFTDSVSSPAGITIPGTSSDAGTTDAGSADAGTTDAGSSDGGRDAGTDGGGTDGGGGGDGDGGGGGGGGGGGCTMTYTGARQLTSPCTVSASNVNQNSVSTTTLTILSSGTATGADSAGLSQGGAGFSYNTDFATGTGTATTTVPAGLNSQASLQYYDQSDWFQSFISGSGSSAGTFSWTVTAVGTPTAQGSGITTYAGTHGSFAGTLSSLSQPDGGTAADVTLTVSF